MSHRSWFYALNFGLLAVFIAAFALDFTPEWKKYQKEYYKQTAAALEKEGGEQNLALAKKLRREPLMIRQILNKDLNRADRCVTCHVAMDEYANPTMKSSLTQHPFKEHPKLDLVWKNHQFTKYGCTVCHQGQGLATTAKAAHGRIEHWEKPMLEGKIIQASCAKCHQNFETLKGAEFAAKGKEMFWKHGCQGCHSIRGTGQIVSVDLGDIADKPLARIAGYNFANVRKDGKPLDHDDWSVQNWVLGHLTNDPIVVTPNDPHAHYNPEPVAPSGMPDFREELGDEGAHAIAAYLMSMTGENIPHKFFVAQAPKPEPSFSDPIKHGKFVFEKYGCAGCHGLGGAKGRRNFNALGAGQSNPDEDMDKGREPTLTDVVGTYTKEELIKKISNGVSSVNVAKYNPHGPTPPLYMPPWKDKIKPTEMEHLADFLLSIAKKDESGF
jgi:mono/diheme cytochrome c family protein